MRLRAPITHTRLRAPIPYAPSRDAPGMAGAEGLELSTSGFGDRRSSQLSYAPSPNQRKAAFHTLWGFVSSMVRCLAWSG